MGDPHALVHPHVRGDNEKMISPGSYQSGSPPRAWGQWVPSSPIFDPTRFTPTCVGTMVCKSEIRSHTTVHPHVRGDNRGDMIAYGQVPGSPPRAWGQ